MKTWRRIGLQQRLRIGQQSGRANYYAERCPDISETMKFVVNELKIAQPTPDLVDYSIAQMFSIHAHLIATIRGEAMAADLADASRLTSSAGTVKGAADAQDAEPVR